MKKILFTGGTGFLGRNLVPKLREKYEIVAPTRQELDLKDLNAVDSYIKNNQFDVIIHAAIPNVAFNNSDKEENLLKDSLGVFLKLHQLQDYYGKMFYFGSGAEYGKQCPIVDVMEDYFGTVLPETDYGLAKYVMNSLCRQSKNIYNLRIFGCYGPTDAGFKLITYVIRRCMEQATIELNKDCKFDFMWVMDLCMVLEYFIENTPQYHDYNVCTGKATWLTDIVHIIKSEMNSNSQIQLKEEGKANEYSGNNLRIITEINSLKFTPLLEGIRNQIHYELKAGRLWKKELQILYLKRCMKWE